MRIGVCLIVLCSCTTSPPPEVSPTSEVSIPLNIDSLRVESAGVLLEQGIIFSRTKLCNRADQKLTASIDTGNLNDAGRAVAYWNIGNCWRYMSNDDLAAEAFFSFIVVGQDILDIRDHLRYAITSRGDFVEHFDLVRRMDDAKGYILAVWAKRNVAFGREIGYPVIVYSILELEAFLEYICGGECDVERTLLHENGVPVVPHTEKVSLTRNIDNSTEQFFIIIQESQ